MESRDTYIRKIQVKLDEWNAEIAVLTARVGEVAADAKVEYNEQIASLKAKQATARQKVEDLQQSGEGAWEDVKSGLDLARTAMSEANDSTRSRFKQGWAILF